MILLLLVCEHAKFVLEMPRLMEPWLLLQVIDQHKALGKSRYWHDDGITLRGPRFIPEVWMSMYDIL